MRRERGRAIVEIGTELADGNQLIVVVVLE